MTDPIMTQLIEALIIIGVLILFKLLSAKVSHFDQVEGRYSEYWCSCQNCTKMDHQ